MDTRPVLFYCTHEHHRTAVRDPQVAVVVSLDGVELQFLLQGVLEPRIELLTVSGLIAGAEYAGHAVEKRQLLDPDFGIRHKN